MRYPYFLSYCLQTPWAMEPSAMALAASFLVNEYGRRTGQLAGDHRDDTEYDEAGKPMAAGSSANRRPSPNIALINVFGTIMQRASDFDMCESGTGAEDIGNALDAALADETVGTILMRFSTPGGSVFGIQELGDKIRAAGKPVIGIADSMAASAGYWLLAQCSEAYVTPGGMVGSIGVYSAHEDVSKALELKGIKVTFIHSGKYKVEGNPVEPLGDEARAEMQARSDAYYAKFTQAVAKGRKVAIEQVRSGMGEGRMLLADAAVKAGMVDGVMTFEQLVKKLQTSARSGRSASAAARAEAAIAEVS